MATMIQTENLSKMDKQNYRVKGLNLHIEEYAIYGFLGHNGAGKSTTMKMLLRLILPSSGEMEIFGKEMNERNRKEILRDVGSLIEAPSYYGHLTGKENLKVVARLKDISEKNISEVLDIVKLTSQKDKLVSKYSMGMKQRLGIAAALLGFPHLLILDEPTNGLDPAGIQEMRELMISLPKKHGITVMISSHILSEIEQTVDTLGIIHKGELVFQDSLAALHARKESRMLLNTTDNAQVETLLAEQGIQAGREGNFLVLPQMPDPGVAALSLLLARADIGLTRLEPREHSLEEIFLEMTGKAGGL